MFKNLRSDSKRFVMHHCQVISLKAFFESIFPVAPLRKLSHAHAVAEERNWEGPGNQQTETTAKIQFHFWSRIGSVDVKKTSGKEHGAPTTSEIFR